MLAQLVVQGQFATLIKEQEADGAWQAAARGLPMQFAHGAVSDTLPSNSNLYRWGLRGSNLCSLCKSEVETLHHILNHCSHSLEQGRFTWRHDSILHCINRHLTKRLRAAYPRLECEVDLPSLLRERQYRFPVQGVATEQRPDIVYVFPGLDLNEANRLSGSVKGSVVIIELTCCFDNSESFRKAVNRKQERYADLISQLQALGWDAVCLTVEVGSRGIVNAEGFGELLNLLRIVTQLKAGETRKLGAAFKKELSSIALNCSYAIWAARRSTTWRSPPYFHP